MSSTHKVMVLAASPVVAEQRIRAFQWGEGVRIIWVGNFIRHAVLGISESAPEQVYEASMVWSSSFEVESEEDEEVAARPYRKAVSYTNVTQDNHVMADEDDE